ncbi:hypothetical protein ABC255_02520 [Neobacillus sp. 3P2-tot-E-2]|uniref:hypothetical protein n=1 Tax=Neobacillus sp. 3P2-tot-E-2 TaxID=3132212 RepID=UPI00399F06A3
MNMNISIDSTVPKPDPSFLDAILVAYSPTSPYFWISIVYWMIVAFVIQSKKYKLEKFEKLAALFSALGLYILSTIFCISKAYTFTMGESWGDIGPLGDLIGGTTVAFFTLASLMLLVGTVRTQRSEMQTTNDMIHIQQVEQTYFSAISSFMEPRNRLITMPLMDENKPIPSKLKSNLLCAPWLDSSLQHPIAYSKNYSEILPQELNQLTVLQYNNSRLYQILFLQSVINKPTKYIRFYGFTSWFDILLLIHFKSKIETGIEEIYDEIKDFIDNSGIPYYESAEAILSENQETVPSQMFSYFTDHFDDHSVDIVFKCFNLSMHVIKKTDSEEDALRMVKAIHYEIPVFAVKNKQSFFKDLPSTLQAYMTIPQSTAFLQFYDEFKWIIRYLTTNLKHYNPNRADFISKYQLYLDHLRNKLLEEDLLCIAIFLAIEYDTALYSGYQSWADSKVLKDLQDKHLDVHPKYFAVDLNHSALSIESLKIEATQKTKEAFISAYKKVEDEINRVAPKILIDNQAIIQLQNDLFESKFFTKLKTNIDLGCMKETLLPNEYINNRNSKDIEIRLKKMLLMDYQEIYDVITLD